MEVVYVCVVVFLLKYGAISRSPNITSILASTYSADEERRPSLELWVVDDDLPSGRVEARFAFPPLASEVTITGSPLTKDNTRPSLLNTTSAVGFRPCLDRELVLLKYAVPWNLPSPGIEYVFAQRRIFFDKFPGYGQGDTVIPFDVWSTRHTHIFQDKYRGEPEHILQASRMVSLSHLRIEIWDFIWPRRVPSHVEVREGENTPNSDDSASKPFWRSSRSTRQINLDGSRIDRVMIDGERIILMTVCFNLFGIDH